AAFASLLRGAAALDVDDGLRAEDAVDLLRVDLPALELALARRLPLGLDAIAFGLDRMGRADAARALGSGGLHLRVPDLAHVIADALAVGRRHRPATPRDEEEKAKRRRE